MVPAASPTGPQGHAPPSMAPDGTKSMGRMQSSKSETAPFEHLPTRRIRKKQEQTLFRVFLAFRLL